jgi:hypothetical protein
VPARETAATNQRDAPVALGEHSRPTLERAYAGFTFAWISAFVAHYLAKDGPKAFMPLVLLALLVVSYMTQPSSRLWLPKAAGA